MSFSWTFFSFQLLKISLINKPKIINEKTRNHGQELIKLYISTEQINEYTTVKWNN